MLTGQEGIYHTDEAEKPIPPKNTWDNLSATELIDVKAQLEDKLYAFSGNPIISKALRQGISQLEAMISVRSSS
jgi:hypothetical protein